MTADDAIAALAAQAEPGRAEQMQAYHKVPRRYLGVANPATNDLTRAWRQHLTIAERVALADDLWRTDIYEARLAAAKLLTQARLRPDGQVWALITSWLPDLDSWAIADHAMMAGQKRLLADPTRLHEVATWTGSDHMWTRRAALVISLPFTKSRHPKQPEIAARDMVLGWCASYATDPNWFIQKAVAWWLRDLSKRDPETVRSFLDRHASTMKAFACKEAAKYL